MLDFLPQRLKAALAHINLNLLYELRMRADKPLRANLNGTFCWLSESGVTAREEGSLVPTKQEIADTLFAASGYSVYSVENQIRQGFITGKEGERIGIAGSYNFDKGRVLSVYDVTALCIRVPHAIEGAAGELYRRCLQNDMHSILLLSPPGLGKTTLLRDLTRLICENRKLNVLVCDERGELSAGDLGVTSDVMKFSDKLTAFTAGIRAMRPDVIITDELLAEDYSAVASALDSGIFVMASAHKRGFDEVPHKIFDRYVVLGGLGKIREIRNSEGKYVG